MKNIKSSRREFLRRGGGVPGRIPAVVFVAACLGCASSRLQAAVEPAKASAVRVAVNDSAWTFSSSRGTLAEYCPTPSPFKPCLKRLFSPGGAQILRDSPKDHKHHHALMFAVRVNGVNFWEEAAGAGKEAPREGHSERSGTLFGGGWSGCSQEIDWMDANGKKLLAETRTVGVVAQHGPKPATVVTWTSELSPPQGPASVTLGGHHYYGLGMRFVTSMDGGGRFFNSSDQPGEVVRGSERLVPAKWCAYTAKAAGKPVTVAIFDHPSNPRHPNKMFTMTQPFAYLSATLNLWKEPLVLKAGETLKLKYAVALWDGKTSPEQVQSLYDDWAAAK